MSTDKSNDSYQVGYGKPPKSGQFKPGNKFGKGRPKGAKNMKTIVMEAATAKLPAKLDGKVKKTEKIILSEHQLANKAAAGDLTAIDMLHRRYERYGPQEDPAGPSPEETRTDLDTLEQFLALRKWFDDGGMEDEAA